MQASRLGSELPLQTVGSKVEVRQVQRTVEVPSKTEKRLIPKPAPVDTAFIVPKFEDREVRVVMKQTITPTIEETEEVVEVPVARYVPYLVPVDVYVPRAVAVPVIRTHESTEETPVQVPKQTVDQLLREMNPHLQQIDRYNAEQVGVCEAAVGSGRQATTEPMRPEEAPVGSVFAGSQRVWRAPLTLSMW